MPPPPRATLPPPHSFSSSSLSPLLSSRPITDEPLDDDHGGTTVEGASTHRYHTRSRTSHLRREYTWGGDIRGRTPSHLRIDITHTHDDRGGRSRSHIDHTHRWYSNRRIDHSTRSHLHSTPYLHLVNALAPTHHESHSNTLRPTSGG